MGNMPDLVCFGEAMLRLSPPHFHRLEQLHQLDAHVGGSEFNVAVGAARLGLDTAWITALPDNPLGRLARNKAREHGVQMPATVWAAHSRLGLYFVEMGAAPRPSAVLYDRAHSAMADLQAGAFDWPAIVAGARAFHTSGITPALGPGPAAEAATALRAARQAGCFTSYDLNYRNRLWTPEEARRLQTPLMEHVDLLITTEEDASVVFGVAPKDADPTYAQTDADQYPQVARALAEKFGFKAVALTMRKNPSVWRNFWSALVYEHGRLHRSAEYDLEVVDRIGAGDALAAGLLFSYLRDGSWERAVAFGAAYSALKHSIAGDCNLATEAEVERLLSNRSLRVAR